MVASTLSYLVAMPERPAYYLHQPPAGQRWRNTRGDFRQVAIEDARGLEPPPSLDREGFALVHHRTAAADLGDEKAVREVYFAEVERLVAEATGATRVLVFDYNLRSAAKPEDKPQGTQDPVRYVHNDYTERSGPQRVRDLFGDEAEDLLRQRFAVVNVWKPIRGPVLTMPLAICDARSIRPDDLVPTDLHYEDRSGEVYSLTFDDGHRWFYFPRMQDDEVMLMKCYDSAAEPARFTAHTAFEDPDSPADAPSRESIEVRTLAFFAPEP